MDLRYFTLGGGVATDVGASPADTLKTKTALRELGHFRTPAWGLTDFPDPPMIEGVKSFQRARGLKGDGRVNPGGPTERAIDRDLARRRAARPDRGSGGAAASRAENLLAPRRPTEFNAAPPNSKPPNPAPPNPAATETAGGSGRGSGGGRRQGVGLFQPNAPADVIRAKRQLASAGHLLGGRARVFDGRADEGLISAIGTFQLENGLTHDNFLLPGGETQRALDSRPRPAANPFARLAIPLAGEADPAEPPPEDDTPRDEAPERENPEREDPDRESPERDDPGGDGPGADRDPREEQEAAVPLFIVLLAAELGLAVMFVYGIYLSMSREDFDDWVAEMRRRKRERGEEDEEEEDSSLSEDRLNNRRCNDRWQREMILCEKRPWEWREGCKRRAGDRLRLCIRHGYPGPKKPARWSWRDEQIA